MENLGVDLSTLMGPDLCAYLCSLNIVASWGFIFWFVIRDHGKF
jgi:hypothetical protein